MIKQILKRAIRSIPLWRNWNSFHHTWEYVGFFKFLRFQLFPFFPKKKYFPYDKNSTVYGNVIVGKNCKVTQRGGCYIQGWGKLFLGDYVEVTQNCIIISQNHNLLNQDRHVPKETIIGDHCWIASNACIMAGVVLGPRTVVGAGSVVTKSFPEGYCLIAGNPARFIKEIPKEQFCPKHYKTEMYGYIPEHSFKNYAQQHLQTVKFHYDLRKVTSNELLIELFMSDEISK